MAESFRNVHRFDQRKLLPGSDIEIGKPTFVDVAGFLVTLLFCFGVIWLTVLIAGIGG